MSEVQTNLPRGYNLIRFEACPSHRAVSLIPVAPMHVSKLVAGDFGAALCGEEWRVAQDVSYLSEGKSYTFCKKCQRAAKAIEEGGA